MNSAPTKILVASGNKHKILELQTVAKEFGLELVSPADWRTERALGPAPEVEETADNYRDNAFLKAEAFCRWSGLPALGDDSGLEVSALEGRPGVLSARYAGPNATDVERNEKLLSELAALERDKRELDRSAAYVCHLSLIFPDGREFVADAKLNGRILYAPVIAGGGFGYDPIVYIDDFGMSFAEVDHEVTCSRGFRALAAKKLFALLVT